MHELAGAWTEKKGLLLIALCAFIYALVLVLFNQVHWEVAGISIRPAAALPVVFGILFGPAAAWGLGIGNIAGDLTGSWSPMSIPGFFINVLYPYLSYLFWHRLMDGHETRVDHYSLACYWVAALIATITCMFILAACGNLFFGRPFESKFISYAGNNLLWTMTAGAVLFWLLLEPAVRKGLIYGREWDRRKAGPGT